MQLEGNEKILYEGKPKKSILVLWFFSKAILSTIIFVFISFWASGFFGGMYLTTTHPEIQDNSFLSFLGISVLIYIFVVTLFFVSAIIYIFFLVKTYHYYITNQRIVFEGGIIVRKKRNIPFHKITDITISQNIIERILKMSSLEIYSASTRPRKAEISFAGLEDTEKPQQLIHSKLKNFKSTGE